MLSTDIPTKFVQPFANNAGASFIVYPIPNTAASPAASLDQGFPTSAFSSGGAPRGKDFNGVLKQVSAWSRWAAAAGLSPYDAAFQTAIGGYPLGAVLLAASGDHLWFSTAESNASNPDTGGANWVQTNLAGHSVTNAKLAQAAAWTAKGNPTSSTADIQDFPFNFANLATGEFQIGPLYVKHGRGGPYPIDTAESISFATAFPTSCDRVMVTPELNGAYGISSDSWIVLDQASLTASGFSFHVAASANSQQLFCNFLALGR